MSNLEELRRRREAALLGGGTHAIKKQHEKGKLTARERVDLLVDPGSFTEIDPFVTHRCQQYPELLKARCPAGTTKLGIIPDGTVYPCNLFFGKEEFRLGNILADPFEEIWGHHKLSFFRTFTGNTCPRKECELHVRCHGGCPAHSYAHTGLRSAPEPRCVPPQ